MRKLGLVGGLGPESTVPYYLGIVYGVRERVGQPFFPPLTIESLSCFELIPLAEAGKTAEMADYLFGGIERLAAAGCEVAALGCNLGHLVFDELERRSPIPLVSVVDATRRELVRSGCKRPILLGTVPTMRDAFFKVPLAKAGMAVLTPGAADCAWLGNVITDELELGVVNPVSQARFAQLVADGAEHGADAVVLACTELPLLTEGLDLGLPVVDTLQVHVKALVDAILEDEE